MQLWYGPPSPFSRKVRIAVIECEFSHRVALVPVVMMNDNPELAALNPLMKVPTLVSDGGRTIYDSRVICEYLDTLENRGRLIPKSEAMRLRVLCRQVLGNGLMEALIFLKVATRRPHGEETIPTIMARQKARIERGLDVLEGEVDEMESESATLGCISVACSLGWQEFNFPDWKWRATRPHLATWFERFSSRTSMRATMPTRTPSG